jgi:hypothetical protein
LEIQQTTLTLPDLSWWSSSSPLWPLPQSIQTGFSMAPSFLRYLKFRFPQILSLSPIASNSLLSKEHSSSIQNLNQSPKHPRAWPSSVLTGLGSEGAPPSVGCRSVLSKHRRAGLTPNTATHLCLAQQPIIALTPSISSCSLLPLCHIA